MSCIVSLDRVMWYYLGNNVHRSYVRNLACGDTMSLDCGGVKTTTGNYDMAIITLGNYSMAIITLTH
jgi:hypothetical protein